MTERGRNPVSRSAIRTSKTTESAYGEGNMFVSNTGNCTSKMDTGYEQKRCERCSTNTRAIINLKGPRRFQTVILQNNFAALESSAQWGCDVCRLVRQGLIYSTASPAEYEALRNSKQSIVLWYAPASTFNKGMFPPSSTDNYIVSCSVPPKSHMSLIPFRSEPESGDNEPSVSITMGQTSGKWRIPDMQVISKADL
jgi:hypothetical protein